MADTPFTPETRAWLAAFMQGQAWPWAILAQTLNDKNIVPMAELRARFEHGLHAMKAGMSTTGVEDAMRPDFMFMQALIDALKGMEASDASQTRN